MILIVIIQFFYSRENKVTKEELLDTFKETIVQNKKGIIETDYNPSYTDNTNDISFQNDTTVLKNAKSFKRLLQNN